MINLAFETFRCLFCKDAPCTAACPKGMDPARGVRAIRFDNKQCAGRYFSADSCTDCSAECEKACLMYDHPIMLRDIALLVEKDNENEEMDLSIDYCGVKCPNPFFLASSVIGNCYEMVARAFEMNWGGVVFKTASFVPVNEVSPRFDEVEKGPMPFLGLRNMEQTSEHEPEEDFATMKRLNEAYPDRVVVASIMGRDDREWATLAKMANEAGVDMIECNFSCPQMAGKGLGSDVGQNPELVRHFTEVVKSIARMPVIAKMTPNITHIEEPGIAAVKGGADSLAAINTIKSVTVRHRSSVSGHKTISGYSGKAVKPIAQRMIVDLATNPELAGIPLSGIGGIETWKDAIEFIRLGCCNVQICTSVMQYGYRIIDDLIAGVSEYMRRHDVRHLSDIVGDSLSQFVTPDQLDRDTYVLPRFDRSKCVGCGRCSISCDDGGHQAIRFDTKTRRPSLDGTRCVGCHLCILVCPVDAIVPANRIPKRK